MDLVGEEYDEMRYKKHNILYTLGMSQDLEEVGEEIYYTYKCEKTNKKRKPRSYSSIERRRIELDKLFKEINESVVKIKSIQNQISLLPFGAVEYVDDELYYEEEFDYH